MKTRAITTIPAIVMRTMRMRSFGERLVTKVRNNKSAVVRASCPQAAAREGEQDRDRDQSEQKRGARGVRKAAIQHALQGEHRRQDQERAEHVRIVEGRVRPAVHEEQIGDRAEQAEVGKDRDDG